VRYTTLVMGPSAHRPKRVLLPRDPKVPKKDPCACRGRASLARARAFAYVRTRPRAFVEARFFFRWHAPCSRARPRRFFRATRAAREARQLARGLRVPGRARREERTG
jgi:hypothetical protein